jgi:hypothetical protein
MVIIRLPTKTTDLIQINQGVEPKKNNISNQRKTGYNNNTRVGHSIGFLCTTCGRGVFV